MKTFKIQDLMVTLPPLKGGCGKNGWNENSQHPHGSPMGCTGRTPDVIQPKGCTGRSPGHGTDVERRGCTGRTPDTCRCNSCPVLFPLTKATPDELEELKRHLVDALVHVGQKASKPKKKNRKAKKPGK
jgi:hypothetical protein